MIDKIKFNTVTFNGNTMWSADIEGVKGFTTYCFETKDLALLAAALFINSGCNHSEFQRLITPTLRMWNIKSAWTE